MLECVFKKDSFDGWAKHILSNGIDTYNNKTKAEYIAEGYDVLTMDDFVDYCNKWEDENLCDDWKEITEEEYDYALNVLPPVKWYNGGFFISERYTSDISAFYQELNGKYFTSLQRWSTPREQIMESLNNYINTVID